MIYFRAVCEAVLSASIAGQIWIAWSCSVGSLFYAHCHSSTFRAVLSALCYLIIGILAIVDVFCLVPCHFVINARLEELLCWLQSSISSAPILIIISPHYHLSLSSLLCCQLCSIFCRTSLNFKVLLPLLLSVCLLLVILLTWALFYS